MSIITGAHSIIYTTNVKADRSFFRDILKLTNVDVGDGWLIFGLPPSEIAFHPSEGDTGCELYLLCDDINAFVSEMKKHNIRCSAVENKGWGMLSQLKLPGGGTLGVYQPRHKRPKAMGVKSKPKAKAKAAKKKPGKAKAKRK